MSQPFGQLPEIKIPNISTALNLNLNTQTQLVVDGQVLANIIKPYLAESLIQYEGSQGSATRDYTMV
jgi:hypothetical protein